MHKTVPCNADTGRGLHSLWEAVCCVLCYCQAPEPAARSVIVEPSSQQSNQPCCSLRQQINGGQSMVGRTLALLSPCRRSPGCIQAHSGTGKECALHSTGRMWCTVPCRTAAKELGTGHLLVWQVQGAAGRPVTPERSGHLHHLAGDNCTCTCRSGPACRLLQLHMTAFWHGSAQGSI